MVRPSTFLQRSRHLRGLNPPHILFGLLPIRKLVCNRLDNGYHRVFANYWDFVRYAKEQRLDLDFTKPPKRPAWP
jgi:hypothetical protein